MDILVNMFDWLQNLLVTVIEWLPFIDNGQAFIESASSWFLKLAFGGGLLAVPTYQILIARYSMRIAKRIFRKIIRWAIITGVIALIIKFVLI